MAVHCETEPGLPTRRIRNLKLGGRGGQDECHTVLFIEDVLEVSESVRLRRAIVERIGAVVRRFDAKVIAQQTSRYEIGERPMGTAIVDARFELAVAAPIEGDGATGF